MFKRLIEKQILKEINKKEILIITGPRRIGKTTLLQSIRKKITKKSYYFDFTDPATEALWYSFSKEKITSILEELDLLSSAVIFFDEIQYLKNAGLLLKLFYDYFPQIKVLATGSSSFLFLQNIGDSLAGRKKVISLYPLSLEEITNIRPKNFWQFKENFSQKEKLTQILEKILVYGAYPEIFLLKSAQEKKEKLKEIVDSYLFKDLLMIEGVKKPRTIVDLAQLLAYQIGSLVNPNELAQTLGIARETVLNYIDLLEKFFIIFRTFPFQKNMRQVIKKKFKVYFYDLGIRNALIGDFSPIEKRADKGFLLENALVLGLKRRIDYERKFFNLYFWQDYDGREVDILLKNQNLYGFEVKWEEKSARLPKTPFKIKEVINFSSSYRFLW
jgi:predicted AAA+ superfamily ATPase